MTMRNENVTQPNSPGRHASSGFSLIELMVTVVIISILASIAIPAYNAQIRKSRRTEAKTALLDLAGREERYFNTNNAYTDVAAKLGYAPATSTVTLATPMSVGSGYYTVTATWVPAAPPAPATYQIVATAVGDQAGDACSTFTVNSDGSQSASGSGANPNVDCWK
jgi:type IV pilus assembly protein PilE